MSLSLGEHGRVSIGLVGISMVISDEDRLISVLFFLVVLLPSEVLMFSMMVAIEMDVRLGLVIVCFAMSAGSSSIMEV